ncbi:EAL domain-containing protein [Hansschlegelia quercus]|uniref:EAL domain-containing protein n=1 Tax=Hansschlegelia quercus TaxID=2528245 RepID=A0A4Q9GQS2_9HYPH|nr:EAL domain-containing protein [Hansschlegelia quercus]TBN55154.1 EAL domain-containing protein [Hansschlegelia quercus]
MTKLTAFFVAVAMAVSAACVGVIAFFGLGLSLGGAMLCGFGALALMALMQLAFARSPSQDDGRLDDLDRVVTDLQSRLTTMEARIATLDAAGGERARAATRPIVEELAALGGLVTSLAKEVAAHDVRFAKNEIAAHSGSAMARPSTPSAAPRTAAPPVMPKPAYDVPVVPEIAVAAAPEPILDPPPAPETPAAKRSPKRAAKSAPVVRPPSPPIREAFEHELLDPEEEMAPIAPVAAPAPDLGIRKRFERALRDNRIGIHLQPIVALPSRRTLHYEALVRMSEGDAELEARSFLSQAAAEGLAGRIDSAVAEQAAGVALRLAASGRTGTVFVNIAPETLEDKAALDEIARIVEDRSEVARLLVLEFGHKAFQRFGAAERTALGRFLERGVRLSIDRAEHVKFEPRELANFGVRFVKVGADKLLDAESAKGASIHPADLSGLMARHGIDLIATHVEEERTVPELLDMDVKAGQGFLFGGARPVRPQSGAQLETAPVAAHAHPRRVAQRSAAAR